MTKGSFAILMFLGTVFSFSSAQAECVNGERIVSIQPERVHQILTELVSKNKRTSLRSPNSSFWATTCRVEVSPLDEQGHFRVTINEVYLNSQRSVRSLFTTISKSQNAYIPCDSAAQGQFENDQVLAIISPEQDKVSLFASVNVNRAVESYPEPAIRITNGLGKTYQHMTCGLAR